DGLSLGAVPEHRIEGKDLHNGLLGGDRRFLRYADFFLLLEEGHHLAQLPAHSLDGLIVRRLPHREELLAAGPILSHPLPRELAGLDLLEDLLHLGARLLVDNTRTACVVAI